MSTPQENIHPQRQEEPVNAGSNTGESIEAESHPVQVLRQELPGLFTKMGWSDPTSPHFIGTKSVQDIELSLLNMARGITNEGEFPEELDRRYDLVIESEPGLSEQQRRKNAEQEREKQTDSKTGLNNLLGIKKAIDVIEDPERRLKNPEELKKMVVGFADIDNFGKANKIVNHSVGDEFIKSAGEDMRRAGLSFPMGKRPRMARRVGEEGGNSDEFIFFGEDSVMYDYWKILSRDFGLSFVEKLSSDAKLRDHISSFSHGVATVNGLEVGYVQISDDKGATEIVSLSTGVTEFRDGDTIQDMIDRADSVMKRTKDQIKPALKKEAKNNGGNEFNVVNLR